MEKFLNKIISGYPNENDCWIWGGSKWLNGYGQFYYDGRPIGAHVFSYALFVGDIPEGFIVHHDKCRNKDCVNYNHLKLIPYKKHMGGHHNEMILAAKKTANTRLNKPVCKNGHELTKENTSFYDNGWRRCITCRRNNDKRRRSK